MAYTVLALSGRDRQSKSMKRLLRGILAHLPDSDNWSNTFAVDLYFKTYAISLSGAETWQKWVRPFKDALLKTQCRTGCTFDSWNPPEGEELFCSRLLFSGLNDLTLNIYFEKNNGYVTNRIKWITQEKKKSEVRFNDLVYQYNPEHLVSAFDFAEWDERCRILHCLGTKWATVISKDVGKFLIAALKDEDAFVRANAVRALGNVGAKDATVAIGKLKDDKSQFVCAMVREALGKLK